MVNPHMVGKPLPKYTRVGDCFSKKTGRVIGATKAGYPVIEDDLDGLLIISHDGDWEPLPTPKELAVERRADFAAIFAELVKSLRVALVSFKASAQDINGEYKLHRGRFYGVNPQ